MPFMRAKMRVLSVASSGTPPTQEAIHMMAVTSTPYGPAGESEDNTYARYTPNGSVSLTINNPALLGQVREGQTFYLDFIPVDNTAP